MLDYDELCLPKRYPLPEDDERTTLVCNLKRALSALPIYFSSPINIEGIEATDLFSMNTLLGGAIETQTVSILNNMRSIWDPNNNWADFEFRRFPESFPDVRLIKANNDATPLIGIELKGWYLLSKEKMPSFRFKACSKAMTPWDLLVCVPWALTNVLSGKPIVYEPYVEQAQYAADMRTYYWEHREDRSLSSNRDTGIKHPETSPYPKPGTAYTDIPNVDGGGNFGRIARIDGLMTDWINESLEHTMAGIAAKYWISFFSLFAENKNTSDIDNSLSKLSNDLQTKSTISSDTDILMDHLTAIAQMFIIE